MLGTDDDTYIDALISAAREACEQECDRAIGSQTLLLTLDAFPSGAIALPRPSATSVGFVKYLDSAGALQTMSNTLYWLDDSSELESWVLPTGDWPTTGDYANAVQVQYVTGWATAPKSVKQWILLMVGVMYENREAATERPLTANHQFFDHLLDRYRVAVV